MQTGDVEVNGNKIPKGDYVRGVVSDYDWYECIHGTPPFFSIVNRSSIVSKTRE